MSVEDERKPTTDDEDNSECLVNGTNTSSSTESDEDDQESSSFAMGYMPLSQQEPDLEDDNEDNCPVTVYEPTEGTVTTDESEQMRLSPDECTCTPTSKLEDNQVDQIKQAMSGFSLPSTAIPEWAKHVPENVWKSELINGIRTKKDDK